MKALASAVLLLSTLHMYAGSVDVDTAKYNYFSGEEDSPAVEINKHNINNVPSRWGFAVMAVPGKVLGLDSYARNEIDKDNTFSVAGEFRYTSQPSDGSPYDVDYNYPSIAFGFRYSFNHGTKLNRFGNDYNSTLGDIATIYGKFIRPLVRTRHFELAYYLGTGIGYSHTKYNETNQVNNEFIGSIWNIYFTAGLQASYKIAHDWSVIAGIDYSHHSNGALYRPNKGVNYLGPFAGLAYTPTDEKTDENKVPSTQIDDDYRKGMFLELSAGLGAKTLLEDWEYSQYHATKDDPNYLTRKYSTYGAFSFQTALMYRYARRWASGIGIDVFYGDYADKIAYIDNNKWNHKDEKHSPWSVGIALKHEAFYKRFSARMGIGTYFYRHMGWLAKQDEKPQWLYERIGLFYSFPSLHGAAIGFDITAHATKADFTELVISYPIKL